MSHFLILWKKLNRWVEDSRENKKIPSLPKSWIKNKFRVSKHLTQNKRFRKIKRGARERGKRSLRVIWKESHLSSNESFDECVGNDSHLSIFKHNGPDFEARDREITFLDNIKKYCFFAHLWHFQFFLRDGLIDFYEEKIGHQSEIGLVLIIERYYGSRENITIVEMSTIV